MRAGLLPILLVTLSGCGVELLTSTAIQGELQAEQLKAVQGQVGRAAESTGQINVQRAIDTYYAEKGSYPASLQALVPDYLPSLPSHADGRAYGYDPATGKLSDAAGQAVNPAGSDAQKIAQIQAAINRYGQTTRFYPPSLSALVPTYLPSVPKASNGKDFLYNPQNGALASPVQVAVGAPGQVPAIRGGVGVGGAGPLGETMTGIGISNQLDSMSNAGSAAAGSRARAGTDSATQQHNQQQEKTMNDLGL